MSRIAMLALAAGAPAGEAEPLARYQALTQVAVERCSRPADAREIVVCGRRAADRWRAPIVGYAPGDPRGEAVSAERARLASAQRPDCGKEAIIANCGGMVGVTRTVSLGGAGAPRLRTPAD